MLRLSVSFLVALLAMSTSSTLRAEDVSEGAYANVYAQRLLSRSDANDDGAIEESEAGRQWSVMQSLDTNHDDKLSLDELTKSPIPYLPSEGEQKLNLLYKKTPEEDLYLDLYYPRDSHSEKLPVVIYTHGGGWSAGSKHGIASMHFAKVYLALLDKGFAVAAVNYRLYEKDETVAMRDCVIDAKDAVRYLAKNGESLGLDPMRFMVHGDSAGGQIAQMLLLSPPESLPGDDSIAGANYRMLAGVSWYGPCDFEKSDLFNHDDRPDFRDRFGPRILKPDTDPKDQLALYREMSPIQYLKEDSPPLLMIQGDKDTTIPVKHAHYMQEKAKAANALVEIMIIHNAGHNWRAVDAAIEPTVDEIIVRTVAFFAEQLEARP